jgi:hypothetical protein
VEHDAPEKLDVVGHHVPSHLVPDDLNRRAQQPPAGLPDGGKRFRKKLVQDRAQILLVAGLDLMKSLLQRVPVRRIGARVLRLADLLEFRLERTGSLGEDGPKLLGLTLQLALGEVFETLLVAVDGQERGLQPLPLAVEPGAEDRGHQSLDHSASK